MLEINNFEFVQAFVRDLGNIKGTSEREAIRFKNAMKELVKRRIDEGDFFEGHYGSKPYSTQPIKAYKLGFAQVTGVGMGKELFIDGVKIDRDDWYWGDFDRERHGLPEPSSSSNPFNFGDSLPKPVPVFIPGYRGWRVDYNGKQEEVDLQFSGAMIDEFDIDINIERGSNQFGGNFSFDFVAFGGSEDKAFITNFFRRWMMITENEIEEALDQSGVSVSSIFGI